MENNTYTNLEMEEDTLKGKYLTFSLDKEKYGIEIKYVTEIIGVQEITTMPGQPEYVKGVINLRGKIIPTMDVRLRFKKESAEYDDRTCIVVVNIKDISVGLIVDRVLEVTVINSENISEPPKFNNDFSNRYIKGIGKIDENVIILLDCNKLLKDDEIENISNIDQ